MRIAVIGAGNGGQAIAGYLALSGHDVSLFDRNADKVRSLAGKGEIILKGQINGTGRCSLITDSISDAVGGAELIMVTTVADAHVDVAGKMAPYIEDGQVIVLNPGRTCGALVFKQKLKECGCRKRFYLAEAQTLMYACRLVENGVVNIIGIKDEVYVSALPSSDNDYVMAAAGGLFPCFKPVPNVLYTSLENIGAMFHPCVCLFNAATIERQDQFWFYRDMTERVASYIEQVDAERLAVGAAYGIQLNSVKEWISIAYKGTPGDSLCEKMKNNPAYYDIKSPGSIFTRQLTEDIPTGVLPILELGKAAGVKTPLLQSMVSIIEALLGQDFSHSGRTLENLGLAGKTVPEIIQYITNEA